MIRLFNHDMARSALLLGLQGLPPLICIQLIGGALFGVKVVR